MFDEAECLGSLPNHLRREVPFVYTHIYIYIYRYIDDWASRATRLARYTRFRDAGSLTTLSIYLSVYQVSLYLHRDMIALTPFFKEAPTSFVATLVQLLTPVFGAPGDFIVTVGEVALEMFFVDMGVVEVWNAETSAMYLTLTLKP